MSRESGEIREASTLLRLNMLNTTNEGSFQVAARGLEMTEGIKISKTAAHKRVRNRGAWLRWLAQEICKTDGNLVRKPAFLFYHFFGLFSTYFTILKKIAISNLFYFYTNPEIKMG